MFLFLFLLFEFNAFVNPFWLLLVDNDSKSPPACLTIHLLDYILKVPANFGFAKLKCVYFAWCSVTKR